MSLINQITTIGPQDAIICCDRIHREIIKGARKARDREVADWLRRYAAEHRIYANFFNKRAAYAIALECAANNIERGGIFGP